MQQPAFPIPPDSRPAGRGRALVRFLGLLAAAGAVAAAGLLAGCGGEARQQVADAGKTFAGTSLTLRCPDRAFAEAVTPAANSWAARTGAAVSVRVEAMTAGDDADVGVIAAGEFGAWADRNDLAPVPLALRQPDHPFQWSAVLAAYRDRPIEWGGEARAVPLAGDGFVVVYRTDRLAEAKFADQFRTRFRRDPVAPSTWEEFADLATAFAALDGKPSLPPLTGAEAAELFFRVAACYDRPALNDSASAELIRQLGSQGRFRLQSFLYDVAEGSPRLDAPAFASAAQWLDRLTAGKCFAPAPAAPVDPAAALARGEAALAVLSLAQLDGLPREDRAVPAKFGLAALPGTRTYTDPKTDKPVTPGSPNYVPYLAGGRLGVVRSRCPRADAAFDLLAEIGGPTRSLELVAAPGLGVGPFRTAHLERDRLSIWFGYGFDADRSRTLQEAMRQYVRPDVRSAVYGLRGPDRAELSAAAAEVFGKVVSGAEPPDAAVKRLQGLWKQIDEKTPKETRLRWRRQEAGVN